MCSTQVFAAVLLHVEEGSAEGCEHTDGLHVTCCPVAETQSEAAPPLLLGSAADASYFAVAVLGRSRE